MKQLKMFFAGFTVVSAFAVVVSFFFPFVNMTFADGETVSLLGIQMCFGGSHKFLGETVKNAVSSYFLFVFLLSVLAVVIAGFAFKSKPASVAAPAFSLLASILFLTFLSGDIFSHVDPRPFRNPAVYSLETASYSICFYVTLFLLIGSVLVGIAAIFVNDYVAVAASGGAKKPMLKRFVRWLLDYKSELKKIVWPSKPELIRNTIVVLVMCAILGALVWVLDFGMVRLLNVFIGRG